MILPWNPPLHQRLHGVIGVLLGILMAALGIFVIIKGSLLLGAAMLMLACGCFTGLARMFARDYERPVGLLGGIGVLFLGLAAAFAVENLYLQVVILVFTVAWSFFVAMGIYNVFIRRKNPDG